MAMNMNNVSYKWIFCIRTTKPLFLQRSFWIWSKRACIQQFVNLELDVLLSPFACLNILPGITKDNTYFLSSQTTGKISKGKDSLGDLMKKLSANLILSKKYVNHCVRVTGINVLHENGMSNEDIAIVTGQSESVIISTKIHLNKWQSFETGKWLLKCWILWWHRRAYDDFKITKRNWNICACIQQSQQEQSNELQYLQALGRNTAEASPFIRTFLQLLYFPILTIHCR